MRALHAARPFPANTNRFFERRGLVASRRLVPQEKNKNHETVASKGVQKFVRDAHRWSADRRAAARPRQRGSRAPKRSLFSCWCTAHVQTHSMATPPPPPSDGAAGKGNGGSEGAVGLKESGNKAFAKGELEQAHTVRARDTITCAAGDTIAADKKHWLLSMTC